jgi:hypothetical protein
MKLSDYLAGLMTIIIVSLWYNKVNGQTYESLSNLSLYR